jgi:hypothetical protein
VTNKPESTGDIQRSFSESDYLLSFLVIWINKYGGEMSMTISLSGTVLSGQLISGKEYFKLLSIGVGTGIATGETGKERRDSFAAAFANATKWYPQMDGTNAKAVEEAYPDERATYLHLKDVYVVTGNIPPNDNSIWRVRLSEIGGWSLGSIAP